MVAIPVVRAPAKAQAGQVVRLSGAGFSPGTKVQILFDASKRVVVGSAIAQHDGQFDTYVVVPKAQPGRHELEVVGTSSSGQPASWAARVVVLADITRDPGANPDLASPVLLSVSIGLPIGTWMVLEMAGSRRRRRAGRPTSQAGGS